MLARLKKAWKDGEQGFTLIELLVVVIIIGILAAIAIPVFLNQRQKGVDAGTQSDVKALATIQETIFTDTQAYSTTKATIDDAGFRRSSGTVIAVSASAEGFCIRGHNLKGGKSSTTEAYWYDSLGGGLTSVVPATGLCIAAATWVVIA